MGNALRTRERIHYSKMSRRVWEARFEEQLAKLGKEDEDERNRSSGDENQ